MSIQHKNLATGQWNKLTLIEQLANVGSEVFRAISWKNKKKESYSQLAFERALELLDITLIDPKNKGRLKEIARARELIVDYFYAKNSYHTTDESLEKYFYSFNYAARA